MLVAAAAGVMVAPLALVKGQSKAPPASVAFEVASVKPGNPRAGGTSGTKAGDRKGPDTGFNVDHRTFTATNANLFALIIRAYGLSSCRPLAGTCAMLSGGPAWGTKDGFDIRAKMPVNAPEYTFLQLMDGRAPQLQRMLKTLLEDRFHLKIHSEKKELPVYALTIGAKGSKLKKADETQESRIVFKPLVQPNGENRIQMFSQNASLQELTELLSKFMDRPVVDRTGLTGRFDFTMDYGPNPDAPGPTGPDMFRAFQEQVGLKLEATKDSVDVLVVDSATRPTAN